MNQSNLFKMEIIKVSFETVLMSKRDYLGTLKIDETITASHDDSKTD